MFGKVFKQHEDKLFPRIFQKFARINLKAQGAEKFVN